MPDWHQYNSPQPISSEVSPAGQNVNHSPIFGPSISPRRLNGSNFSPEGLNKPQNDANFNPRNFQQSPNTIRGPNLPPENSAMGSAAQMPGCHGHYGATPSPRNAMIETTSVSLDSRIPRGDALNEAIGQRNHQISINAPPAHLNCPTINGSMGMMGQRNTPTGILGPIPNAVRQPPGSYVACKGPCCNSDTNLSYQSWEKFGPYPPNIPYRETSYPVDNRRFGSEFDNRESMGSGAYNVDPRRNFPDYKYQKDSIIPRGYAQTSSVIQNYPAQNYNFPGDYQKYQGYPVKEYPRDNSITNSQNPAILKYQEQSVIVQQKYFTKQIQYQNGIIPKSIVPANMGGNVISRAQNPYFNPQLARDIPRDYSESTSLANRGIQSTNSIHANYPNYQMYQQKIAMQRFSMESHLRELTRIPGYQSHPKYQESILRYRELLRLQQAVDYQSTVQDPPRVIASQVNDEIRPINLQFDQNGMLINSNFAPAAGFTNLQNSINSRNSKTLDNANNREMEPQNPHHLNEYKTQASFDNPTQDQDSSSLSQSGLPRENEERFSIAKELDGDQYRTQKSQSGSLNVPNPEEGQTSSLDHKNLRDFADKPELDVRQFLANWDESEDEDGVNASLPDVASNTSTSVVVEYGSTKSVPNSIEESENCSETQNCQGRDDHRILENTQNEIKSSNSPEERIREYDLPAVAENSRSLEENLNVSDPLKNPIRIGTVIRSTSTDCETDTTFCIMENLTECRDTDGSVKSSCQETETSNIKESQEASAVIKVDVTVKQESSIEEETITSIKEHIEAYKYKDEAKICSSIEETIRNDDNSRSSVEKDLSQNTKNHHSSSEDISESSDTDDTDSDSISSFIKSPETIRGTEIHVDAHELSISPKSNTEILDNPDLQKQSNFVNEESHNPDDISLPDLPTSECTPISTTLNTPIHSDSEESSEPVIDLTIPTNPIEIIQNSPILSFMHSPIKMEPYEHFDDNDLTDKASHDDLEFKFQTSNTADNDFEKPINTSSRKTERYNVPQNDENTFGSDCIEILSENSEHNIDNDSHRVEMKDVLIGSSAQGNESPVKDLFTFKKERSVISDVNSSTDADQQARLSVTTTKEITQISDVVKLQDDKNVIDKSENLSNMKRRLSISSARNEELSEDELACMTNYKNYPSSNQWQIQPDECVIKNVECESADSLTALNLVKDESKINSDSIKLSDETTNSQAVRKESMSSSSCSSERMDFQNSNRSEWDSSMDSQEAFTSSENTEFYSSSSEEDQIYIKTTESQSNFPNLLNIPLIPGEDFEEPKMPVLPMEGNCLTKIIKNTSPIIDLDVLGSDDEKLDKIDDIWMEVGGVDTVSKVVDVNPEGYPESGESSKREKSLGPKNNVCKLQKSEWKLLKNSVKAKDDNKSVIKILDEDTKTDIKRTDRKNSEPDRSSSLKTTKKETETIDKNFQSVKISPKVPTTQKITMNSSFRESGNSLYDISSENNATVIMKSQEKANHINDIATKLLENARLYEPELRKMEALKSKTNCSGSSGDSSKNSIKLLKEFRKVKHRTTVCEPTIKLENPVDDVGSNIVSPIIEITGECAKMNEIFKTNEEIRKYQDNDSENDENFSQKRKILTEKVNINVENNRPRTPSPDIASAEEIDERMLKDNEEVSLENEDTFRKNHSIVNITDNVGVRDDTIDINDKNLNRKVVNNFEEDINESAINLSKSSNGFDSPETLKEKGCKIDYSFNYHKMENINTEEIAEIASKINQETNFIDTQNGCCNTSQSVAKEDNAICSQFKKENSEDSETKSAEQPSVAANDCERIFTSSSTNSPKECVLNEGTSHETDQKLTTTTDDENSEKLFRNPEEIKDSIKCHEDPGKITTAIQEDSENFTDILKTNVDEINAQVSEPDENIKVNDLVAIGDEKNYETDDKIIDPEISHGPKNVRINMFEESMIEEERSIKEMDNCNDGPGKDLSNTALEEKVSIQTLDDLLPRIDDGEQETDVTVSKINSDQTSPHEQLEDVDKSITTKEIEKNDPMTVDDCSMNDQKSIKDLDTTSEFQEAVDLIHENTKSSTKSVNNSNKSPVQASLEELLKLECFENSDLNDINLPSGSDKSSRMVDNKSGPFELDNSFNCDFNNFDVAPNINSTADHDESNSWKYSEACARFEECERYKNPDNFTTPILTSLESLDNLNTVPVYTTKDGKITYSPNPKYTYRALIIEAREREGYPVTRESYYGNSKIKESSHYSKNSATFRKRKNSEGYSYSRSYGKKNYEPREHGESSTKNPNEPWNRNAFNHNKYRHQTRDRNSHHSAHHDTDAEKNITSEKISNKYKNRKGASIFEEYNKTRNGTSSNYRCSNANQYRQSKEQSTLNFSCSRTKQDLKQDHQNISAVAPSRSDADGTFDDKKNKNVERETSLPDLNKNYEPVDFSSTDKSISVSDRIEHISECIEDTLVTKSETNPSSVGKYAEIQVPLSKQKEFKSTSPETEDQHPNDRNILTISSIKETQDVNVQLELLESKWEDSSENLVEEQKNLSLTNIPSKPLQNEIKAPELYDDIDICENLMSDINKNESHDADSSNAIYVSPTNFTEFPEINERLNEADCEEAKLDAEGDESAVNNGEDKVSSGSTPPQLVQTDESFDEPKVPEVSEISEMPDTNRSTPDLNADAESIREDKLDEPVQCIDNQMDSIPEGNCSIEVKDFNYEDLSVKEISGDKTIESENWKPVDETQINLTTLESNNEILHSFEASCALQSLEDTPIIARKESRIESNKCDTESRTKTSVENLKIKCNKDLSVETKFERENVSKFQSQTENYIAYSPSNESPEDAKAIPKLVIKKTDSLNCKHICTGQPSIFWHDPSGGKATDREEQSCKGTVHPKIPKILIRNVKSRPGTPSIDEIIEKKVFSVTTKEENKVPKVKIRFEEKRSNSPAILPAENASKTETSGSKIPKMKIKLEDRLPKIFNEYVNTEPSLLNMNIQKIIPKMKIKKLKGALSQVVDTHVLPVSIPRMFIYTDFENEKQTSLNVTPEKEFGEADESLESVVPNLISSDQKTIENADCKKVPKLKIKRQSSGCSVELTRKRHNVNPVRSELKKTKKSLKPIDSDDRKQFNRLSLSSENLDSSKKDSFGVKQSYEVAGSSKNAEYTTTDFRSQSTIKIRSDQKNSTSEKSVSLTPEEIPKVIIKRASPSAEFKCELSKGKRDAIITNRRWQPEVKLQRSWVLDCMAKDLNLDKLRLKLATPGSILPKSSTQNKSDLKEKCVKSDHLTTDRRKEKLFRSKSTSDLVLAHGDSETLSNNGIKLLNETNLTDSSRKLTTRKRCKSDLDSMFENYLKDFQCKKKLKFSSDPSNVQPLSKRAFDCVNDSINPSEMQSTIEERNMVIEKIQKEEESLYRNLKNLHDSDNIDSVADLTKVSNENPDNTLDENMNSQSNISVSKIDNRKKLLVNNENLHRLPVDADSNSEMSSSSKITKNNSNAKSKCLENTDQINDTLASDLKVNERLKINDSYLRCSSVKRRDKSEDQGEVSAATTAGNLESTNHRNEKLELDMNENLDDNVTRIDSKNRVSQNLTSHTTVVEQGSNSTCNENVLKMPINNSSNPISLDITGAQNPKVDGDMNNSLSQAIAPEDNSVLINVPCAENQSIVENLLPSPSCGESYLVKNKDNDMCLYHEDAIPTQYELELEMTDHVIPDALEVPIPQNDYCIGELRIPTSDELDKIGLKPNRIFNNSENVVNIDNLESETSLPGKNGTNSYTTCATTNQREPSSAHTDKQDTILAGYSDERESKSEAYGESVADFEADVDESLCETDSLMKKVLAAKETLRKCFRKSKNESRFKVKSRPKTAAEKKQGSSFDLRILTSSKDCFKPINQNIDSASRSEKSAQNQMKTEFIVNTIKSERKHSKGNKNNFKQKQYSTVPTIVQKYTNLTPTEGCNLIPQRSSIDFEDRVAFTDNETTISLKNSKHLIKNASCFETQKKTPELINSKDSKCKSKSSRRDGDSKCIEQSKSTLLNITVRESIINFDHSKEKSVSDTAHHKYKSLRPLSDQNVKTMTDKTKFKLYKIPKLIKPTHSQTETSTEGPQEPHSREVRMPILEPQVDINHDLKVFKHDVGRESSRSPPVITNQEIVVGCEMTTQIPRNYQCQASSNKEKEILLGERGTALKKETSQDTPSYSKETTVADIVNNMAYHEKVSATLITPR